MLEQQRFQNTSNAPPRPSSSTSSSQSHSHSGRRLRPVISLSLHPSQAVGPFVLGTTIYQVLHDLRTPAFQSLYPQVDIDFNAQDPRKAPLVVRPYHRLHCVFDSGAGGRLRCIVVDLGERESESDEKLDEAHRRDLKIEYYGKELLGASTSTSASMSTAHPPAVPLTRGSIQQLFGPTYPARKHITPRHSIFGASATSPNDTTTTTTKTKWVLSYEGIAFLFDEERSGSGGSADLHKDAQPSSLVIYAGEDPLYPDEVQWPQRAPERVTDPAEEHDQSLAFHDCVCQKAVVKPQQGLVLHLASASPGVTTGTTTLPLQLNTTTQHDVLLDLGYPQRRWIPGGDVVVADVFNADALPEFWSYPSLGIDLLFASAHQGPLTKIIVHSDVPGSATWSRYEFVPWVIDADVAGKPSAVTSAASAASATPGTSSKAGKKKAKTGSAASSDGSDGSSTDAAGFVKKEKSSSGEDSGGGGPERTGSTQLPDINTDLSTLHSLLPSANLAKEVMTLDRSAEAEFKSLLQLDVRTQLRGSRGLVMEILPLPIRQQDRHDEDDGGSDARDGDGIVVALTIVS